MEAVLFDLDGTLVRLPIDYRAMRDELKSVARRYGLHSEFKPLLEEIKRLSCLHPDGDKLREECLRVVKAYEFEGASRAQLLKGVKECLHMLKEKGIKIAVVSNNSKESVERALEVAGVRDFVDLLIGRTNLTDVKPDPSLIVKALNGLGVKADKVVFVGDSESDMIAAGKAGVRFIKVDSTSNSIQRTIQMLNKN